MDTKTTIMGSDGTATLNESLTPLEAIAAEFDAIDWNYTITAKELQFYFPARPFTGRCVARVHGDQFVLILITLGLFVPEPARPTVVHFANRRNWNLLMGNLEMDEEDGEVRLRYTYPLVAGRLDGERAVGSIMQLCSIAGDVGPELLQATAHVTKPSAGSDTGATELE